MNGLLKEFCLFLREETKWWLVPMLLVMKIVAVLVVLTMMFSNFAPFIYAGGM